jgi:3-hydroxyacyl-CoA dehydrogenase
VRGADTSAETIAATVALGERLGKVPVVVGNCDGFVGNRMLLGYKREAEFAVLAGASPERVDGALEAFGFAMGPFAVSDLAGIDVGWRAKHERIKRGAASATPTRPSMQFSQRSAIARRCRRAN